MKSHNNPMTFRALSLATGVALASLAAPLAAQAEITGNLGVYSKYVLRGITNGSENDNTAVQGGIDWTHSSGVYLGYWGSNLSYASGTAATPTGFENDVYGGYSFSAGPVNLSFGAIYYVYLDIDDSNTFEAVASAGIGPVTLGMKYLTEDVAWGNKGDIYWTADFEQKLPKDFTFGASLGYYTYDDTDPGSAAEPNLIAPGTTTENSAFRHLNLSLSHPLGATGADMSITYVIGGKNRSGIEQRDTVVLGLSTTF